MAGYLPPGSPFIPPPPPRSVLSRQLYHHYHISSGPTNNKTVSPGAVIGAVLGAIAYVLVVLFVCRYRNRRANAAAHAAAVAVTLPERHRVPPPADYWNNEEQWLHGHGSDRDNDGGTRRGSPTADLPSFTYNRAVRHNVTGSGRDEAATCSVCLGVFQVGETVRLLLCLHLYHVECIDPWIEAHSTCPVCRSGTDDDPTMHGGMLPIVHGIALQEN